VTDDCAGHEPSRYLLTPAQYKNIVNASRIIIIIICIWERRNDNILYINYLCDSKHELTVWNFFIFFLKDNLCKEELCLQYFNNRKCNFLQMFIGLKRRDYKMALLFMLWFFGTMQHRYNFWKQLPSLRWFTFIEGLYLIYVRRMYKLYLYRYLFVFSYFIIVKMAKYNFVKYFILELFMEYKNVFI